MTGIAGTPPVDHRQPERGPSKNSPAYEAEARPSAHHTARSAS